MEIAPPLSGAQNVSMWYSCRIIQTIWTHDVVVFAAHSVGRAAVGAADADDGDGRARQPNERVHVLDDDPERREDLRRGGVARLLDGVAALDRARAARRGRVGGGGGDGKDCEGGEGGELGEHGVLGFAGL